jgi:hypothetical protein
MYKDASTYSIVMGSAINIVGLTDKTGAAPRILSFMSRPSGWKFGRGKQPAVQTVAAALSTAALLIRLRANDTGAFLTEAGDIVVTGYYEKWHVEMLCSSGARFLVVVEKDGSEVFEREYSLFSDAAFSIIEQVRKWGNATSFSGYFTSTTLTSNSAGFRVGLSIERPVMETFLSSVYFAQMPKVDQFAITYNHSTSLLSANHLYPGSSIAPLFHLAGT